VVARARNPGWKLLALLLGLLLIAFGLRVAGLEQQSIWVDEGFSVDFSSRTASDMTAMWKARGGASIISDPQAAKAANDPLAIAVDIHPPLYYFILHEWMPLAGRGEYAVRFPSVMVGVLLALILYKLGASLGSRAVGLSALGVGTLAPFYIAYSQEARMYAPVALFSALSLYFTWKLIRGSPHPVWAWLGLVATSSLALYTHYSSVLAIVAENVLVAAVILWRLAHRKGHAPLVSWTAAQLVQLALFFPWLRTTIGQVAKYNENLWVPNWQHELIETFRAFDAGLWLPLDEGLRLEVVATAILLAGVAALWTWRWKRRPSPSTVPLMAGGATDWHEPASAAGLRRILLFGGGALAVEVLLALAVFQIRPEFHPRYLMVLATPYYLLLGLALVALWRRFRPAALLAGAGLAAIFVVGLAGYEFDPNFAKDDTRTLAQYLTSVTTASDLIVMDAPEPLGYYYHGPAEMAYIPGDEATAAAKLTQLAAGKSRVVLVHWFLSTSDPEQLMPFLLQKYGRQVERKGFRGYSERIFALPPDTSFVFTPTTQSSGANFDNVLQLQAYGLGPAAAGDSQLLAKLDQPLAVSGQALMLALKWRLLAPVAKDYKVTAYLTDESGHLGGQVDLLLRYDQAATSRWAAGEEATDYYVLPTLPGLMPGQYRLHVAVYPDGEQERLSVLDAAGARGGGSLDLASVAVLPPTTPAQPEDLGLPVAINRAVNGAVNLVGTDKLPATVIQGETLPITLGWQAVARPPAELQTTIALLPDGQSAPAWQTSIAPRFPTANWRAGDVFRDWYDVTLPSDLAAGSYQVLVGLGGNQVPVGRITVQVRKRDFTAPSPEHPLTAQLGGSIELLGYDQDKPSYSPGATARITLYWRGQAPMNASYTAFLHALDGGRHVVAQVDSIPDHGLLPTTAWLPGEIVRDVYELPLKPDLSPSTYQLEAGFYRADTGVRLKASSPDVQAIDDGLLIGPLVVK